MSHSNFDSYQAAAQAEAGGADRPGCCGSAMTQTGGACPCGSMFRRRGFLLVGGLVVGLALLISQIGGILGIIAFLRTL